MSRFDDNPAASVRAFLDSRKHPEPTTAEFAAEILGDYGFTAEDILDALAAGGTITILPLGPGEECPDA